MHVTPQIRPCQCGAAFAAPAVLCGCADATGGEPDWEEGEGGGAPSVAAGFSEAAVLFEERYEDAPGVWVGRRSTRTVLTVEATGGACGGTLTVAAENLGRLRLVSGTPPPQGDVAVAAHGSVAFAAVYEAGEASGGAGDIAVRASFAAAAGGDAPPPQTARATAVRIELRPEYAAPENTCANRHQWGVGEYVRCFQYPSSPQLVFTSTRDGSIEDSLPVRYHCPLHAESGGLSVSIGGVSLAPSVSVIEPSGIECTRYGFLPPTLMEGYGMLLELHVRPYTVSFQGLAMQEVPSTDGVHTGYFNRPEYMQLWFHTATLGAGVWMDVGDGNLFGFDQSRLLNWMKPWSSGVLEWTIPIGWNAAGTVSGAPVRQKDMGANARWTLESNLLTKTKHGQTLSLDLEGVCLLNGEPPDEP